MMLYVVNRDQRVSTYQRLVPETRRDKRKPEKRLENCYKGSSGKMKIKYRINC